MPPSRGRSIVHLSRAVADGVGAEANSTPSAISSPDERLVEAFRDISKLKDFHRGSPDAPTPEGVALRAWGNFEILETIGEGAYGTVYLATDVRLERRVALKLLRERWTDDPQSRAALVREGGHLARIRHPNVATVYGADEFDGRVGLSMEYIKGKSLEQILREQGPMSEREAALVGLDVCRALSAVHAEGVLHRDVKAENIIREEGGRFVLADFGVGMNVNQALFASPAGTPLYLAPEILEGKPPSVRSDLYAVGVLLFHLVTNRYPVSGSDLEDLRRAHREEEASLLRDLRPGLSPAFLRVVDRALEPDPSRRIATAGHTERAVTDALGLGSARGAGTDEAVAQTVLVGAEPRVAPRSFRALVFALLALTGVAVLLASGLIRGTWSGRDDLSPSNVVAHQLTTASGWEGQPAISPDGNFVAYVSDERGNADIWLVDIDGRSPLPVTSNPAVDSEPTWFPDGKTLAFVSDRSGQDGIWKVSMLGGSSTQLVGDATDPAISPDGREIAFARRGPDGTTRIVVAPVDQPERARVLTNDADGLWDHRTPSWSPDGTRIAYASHARLWVISEAGGVARPLTPQDSADREPTWSPDGAYVYFTSVREGTTALWRVPSGGGVLERVTTGVASESSPSLSADGSRLAYATLVENYQLMLWDLEDGVLPLLEEDSHLGFPTLAPDQSGVVFVSDRGGNYELWRQELERGAPVGGPRQLTDQPGTASHPTYSPDGEWIAYYLILEGQRDVWTVPSEGGTPIRFTDHEANDIHPSWSPDGGLLAFASERETEISQIWIAPVANGTRSGTPRRLTRADAPALAPTFSPDGTEVAYITEGPSDYSVWIVSSGGGDSRRVISAPIIGRARWIASPTALLLSGQWADEGRGLRKVSPNGLDVTKWAPEVDLGLGDSWVFDASRDGRLLSFTRTVKRGNVWYLGRATSSS